jgi:poly(hydroxyalkanoate) granule-associated protein
MAAKRASRKRARGKSSAAQSHLTETVHQIWLAGLGAVAKAQQGTPQLLEELISEGARVDSRVRGAAAETLRNVVGNVQDSLGARVSGVRGQAAEAVDGLEKIFRSRVRRALTQLGVPSAQEIEALSKRVDTLNANIGKLTERRAASGRRRSRARGGSLPTAAP